MPKIRVVKTKRNLVRITALVIVMVAVFVIIGTVGAQEKPFHPTFPFLDREDENVLESSTPVSTMITCGACHDTGFIEEHSFHADVGLSEQTDPGETASGRAWDTGTGLFGRWNPLIYRYLSPVDDNNIDLTTAEWNQLLGVRHAGGGPAIYGRDGVELTNKPVIDGDPETHITDPVSGELIPWDWNLSGSAEMNCFLCHTPEPNNEARISALHEGDFQWSSTATLLGSGIVEQIGGGWLWNDAAFTEDGHLAKDYITLQGPRDENCANCHGLVHVDSETPLALAGCSPEQWSTITTGQIVSPQRISDSGLNISSKEDINRSWDVHAERVVGCTDCHYSLNNPIYYQEADDSQPDHLIFDPRRIDHDEYLYRPLHQFAKGQSAQGTVAPELDNSLRRCESCHSIDKTHNWLPYKDRHMEAVNCESCHIPEMYAPSRAYMDWTVVNIDGSAQTGCRGISEEGETFSSAIISSYTPTLLPRQNNDGSTTLAPHNLLTSWFWIYDESASSEERPVPLRDLQAVWLSGDDFHPDILALFDADGDGQLNDSELRIDSDEKQTLIASRLISQGLKNPRISGEIQPYSINHDVTYGKWATRECSTCHGNDSLITEATLLADRIPGGIMPTFVGDSSIVDAGSLFFTESGELYYQLETSEANLFILGHDSVSLIDWAGSIIFLGTVLGVAAHSSLRLFASRRNGHADPELQEVYMYSFYERLWHWLQTIVILILLFTGLIIHKPDIFGIFSFSYVVQVHNIMALILVINAFLAAFYHLASGEIQQFLPRPRGFFDQSFSQAKYYLHGIFRGDAHPFEKTPQRKMNSLQQVTYFAILNVLLPLQIVTGVLMWGAQRWPDTTAALGGLSFLSPVHTLISWLFASFIVMHVYLTTTGPKPLTSIKGMIMGWDEVEVHTTAAEAGAASSADNPASMTQSPSPSSD